LTVATDIHLFDIFRDHMDGNPTTGQLQVDGDFLCYTLERPWADNAPNVSCIPLGAYDVRMAWSNHFQKDMPHIVGVPGRSDIMLHPLNFVWQTQGCVGLGDKENGYTLVDSADAFTRFLAWFQSVGEKAQVCFQMAQSQSS
jgi:hypothetical protein